MKVSIEIDLTPEEARSLLGMPDMKALQDTFVDMAKDKLEATASLVELEPMLKTWSGIGGLATDALSALVGVALKAATQDTVSPSRKEDAQSKPASDKPAT
jgi:hypothetical protein